MPPRTAQNDTPADDAAEEQTFTQAELTAIIRQALAAQADEHSTQMRALSDQVTGLQASIAGSVPILIPENASGPGTDTAETWSQWEQDQAWLAREAASA